MSTYLEYLKIATEKFGSLISRHKRFKDDYMYESFIFTTNILRPSSLKCFLCFIRFHDIIWLIFLYVYVYTFLISTYF